MAQRHGGHGGDHDRGSHSSARSGDRGGHRGGGDNYRGNRGNRSPQASRPARAVAPQREMAVSPRQSRPPSIDRRGGMVRNQPGKDRVRNERVRSVLEARQNQARPDRNDRRDNNWRRDRDDRRDNNWRGDRGDHRGNNWRDGRRHDGRGGHAEGRRDWRGSWNRGWRNDHRYNWRGWRSANRRIYHLRPYYAPYRGWSYRRFGIGIFLDPLFFGQSYWIGDPFYYRLPPAPPGTQWVRYYNDVLLVDIYSGEVVDAIYDFFW
jgi:hypothetical protein